MSEQPHVIPAKEDPEVPEVPQVTMPPAPAAPLEPPVSEPVAFGLQMKRRHPWGVWGLGLVTLGIYYLVWWYKIHAEMARYDRRQDINPVISLVAVWFGSYILVPPFWSTAAQSGRINRALRAAGQEGDCSGGLGILLFILSLTVMVYYQSELNKIIDSYRTDDGMAVAAGERVALYR
jgi:Domain of unknown function (DUF4234)